MGCSFRKGACFTDLYLVFRAIRLLEHACPKDFADHSSKFTGSICQKFLHPYRWSTITFPWHTLIQSNSNLIQSQETSVLMIRPCETVHFWTGSWLIPIVNGFRPEIYHPVIGPRRLTVLCGSFCVGFHSFARPRMDYHGVDVHWTSDELKLYGCSS